MRVSIQALSVTFRPLKPVCVYLATYYPIMATQQLLRFNLCNIYKDAQHKQQKVWPSMAETMLAN